MSMPALQRPRSTRLPRLGNPAAAARARLTVVPRARSRAPRMPFLALVTLVLVGGVVGLLMFNTSMQQASFAEASLEREATALNSQQQQLEAEIEDLRDPQRVAEAAQAQGMVLPASTAFLLPDGSFVGQARPATRENPLTITPRAARRPGVLDPAPIVVTARASEVPAPAAAAAKPGRSDRTPASHPGRGRGNR